MIAVADIAYVEFAFRDLERAERFYTDFGLRRVNHEGAELLMRSASDQPYVLVGRPAHAGERPGLAAIGLRATQRRTLEDAATLPEAGELVRLQRPGGGLRLRLDSPMGIAFDLVFGIEAQEPLPMREPAKLNHALAKSRHGEWQRIPCGPAEILRLGHVALLTPDFVRDAAWLQDKLGLRPSDLLFDGTPDNRLGGFFHCTAESRWVDHHTIALFPGPEARVHHCSFEVQDMDTQFLGNKWLGQRGWQPLWGVGRHILGSQVFDYWFDPEGNVVEHFTDGDLVKPGIEPGLHQVSDDALAQWGPPMDVQAFVAPWSAHKAPED